MPIPSKDLTFHAYNMINSINNNPIKEKLLKEELFIKSKEIHALFQNDSIKKIVCDFPVASIKNYNDQNYTVLKNKVFYEKRIIDITNKIIPYQDNKDEFMIKLPKSRINKFAFFANLPMILQIANYGIDNSVINYAYMCWVIVSFLSVSRSKRAIKFNIIPEYLINNYDKPNSRIFYNDERNIQEADHVANGFSKGEVEVFFDN